jgi:hypothetical protein
MGTEAEHQLHYQESRALLDGPPPLIVSSKSWATTVAFYAAVHLVERLAARDGKHHRRHSGDGSRNTYLARHLVHRIIKADFMALYSASLIARYESPTVFAVAYPGDVVQTQLIDGCLTNIEAYVAAVFAPPPAPPVAPVP